MSAPSRGGVSSGEVAGRHPTQAPAVLLGLRLLARIFGDEAIFAASACQDREFAGAVSSPGYGDIALRTPKLPPSLSAALSSQTSVIVDTKALFPLRGPRPFHFCARERHEERALDRAEERRVGKDCVSTCKSRGSPYY